MQADLIAHTLKLLIKSRSPTLPFLNRRIHVHLQVFFLDQGYSPCGISLKFIKWDPLC